MNFLVLRTSRISKMQGEKRTTNCVPLLTSSYTESRNSRKETCSWTKTKVDFQKEMCVYSQSPCNVFSGPLIQDGALAYSGKVDSILVETEMPTELESFKEIW